jgi:antitoxin VapB
LRIPKDLAFSGSVKKVIIRKVGKSRVITPVDALWDDFFALPGIDIAEPDDLPVQERERF